MKRFREWLEAPWWASDLVLVDGHCGYVATDKVSPMSGICASLAGVLTNRGRDSPRDGPAAMVLHHFCGQHLTHRDTLKGPGGLIRSFAHQLLVQSGDAEDCTRGLQVQVPLEFMDAKLLRGVDEHDIASLCRLFAELVVRLHPSRPVFCIIDGVSEIETALDSWQDDTCLIVKELLGLVEDAHRDGPGLRVLLTSSTRSAVLADWVVPSERQVSLLTGNTLAGRSYPSLLDIDLEDLLMAGEARNKFGCVEWD
jgi:hypothetical protein